MKFWRVIHKSGTWNNLKIFFKTVVSHNTIFRSSQSFSFWGGRDTNNWCFWNLRHVILNFHAQVLLSSWGYHNFILSRAQDFSHTLRGLIFFPCARPYAGASFLPTCNATSGSVETLSYSSTLYKTLSGFPQTYVIVLSLIQLLDHVWKSFIKFLEKPERVLNLNRRVLNRLK